MPEPMPFTVRVLVSATSPESGRTPASNEAPDDPAAGELITGTVLRLDEPLSLWGGLDPKTGEIIDRRHPQSGTIVTGRILVMPSGRGSSSASSILLESVRRGTMPAAIVLAEVDGILALGATVAREIYDRTPPIFIAPPDVFDRLQGDLPVQLSGEALTCV